MNPTIVRQIVVQGDTPFLTAGTKVWDYVGGRIQWNVAHGQPVAYLKSDDGKPPVAVDLAGLTEANKYRFLIGVGDSPQGSKGVVTGVRHLGAEKIGNSYLEHTSVASPVCGNPAVQDMYVSCVSCDTNYTVELGVRDNHTQSYTDTYKDYANWFMGYTPNCKQCADCDTTITCGEVVDGLIKNFYQPGGRTLPGGQPYPDYRQAVDDYPFQVTKIYDRSLTYCLSFAAPASDCEDCHQLPAFDSVTIGGTVIDLSAVVTPTDNTVLFRSQLDQVENIINTALDASETVSGRAYLTGVNYNTCCPMQLHVNTDDADFVLTGDGDVVVTPSVDVNPFAVGQPGENFTCGLRIIGAPLEAQREEEVDRMLQSYFRKVRITAIGEGFSDSLVADIQKAEIPGGFGTMIQHAELTQSRGGSGRDFSSGSQRGGWLGNHRSDSHVYAAVTARKDKDYCSYYIRSRNQFANQSNQLDTQVINSFLHVESDATAVNAEVKAFIDKLATLSMVNAEVTTVTCEPLVKTC
jgi:hypothetical protein